MGFSKKVISLLLLTLLTFLNINALASSTSKPENTQLKSTGKSLSDFIPVGWKLLYKAEGDLNKDNLKDIAAVIEYNKKGVSSNTEISEAPARVIFILFKQKSGGYKLSISSSKLIMKEDQGGVWGDPFQSLVYNRGSVLVSFYGGSNWRWAYTYRFRYQDKGWFLIGQTDMSQYVGTGESVTADTNYLTGLQIITSIDTNHKVKKEIKNLGRKKLKNLKTMELNM